MAGRLEKIPLFPIVNSIKNMDFANKGKALFIPIMDMASSKGKWKICITDSFMNCEKIHPLQQKKVQKLLQGLKKDSNVKRVIIFGSSVEDNCRVDSDVDFYVELFIDKKIELPLCDFPYDMWTNFTVDYRMLKEIQEKGVIVYE